MIVTLELRPEIEKRLIALAARQAYPLRRTYKISLSLASLDEEPTYDSITPEQWAKEFEAWLDARDYIIATLL